MQEQASVQAGYKPPPPIGLSAIRELVPSSLNYNGPSPSFKIENTPDLDLTWVFAGLPKQHCLLVDFEQVLGYLLWGYFAKCELVDNRFPYVTISEAVAN